MAEEMNSVNVNENENNENLLARLLAQSSF